MKKQDDCRFDRFGWCLIHQSIREPGAPTVCRCWVDMELQRAADEAFGKNMEKVIKP